MQGKSVMHFFNNVWQTEWAAVESKEGNGLR